MPTAHLYRCLAPNAIFPRTFPNTKIPHSKSQPENAVIRFLEIIRFVWWFLVFHNPWELGGSKWWVPKSAAKKTTGLESTTKKDFGKQRPIKCIKMLMKLESSFFQNPKIFEEKNTLFCVSLELSRSYRSKNRTQSLASSLRLCPVGHQDFLYIPPDKWCSGHCVWKGVMNRSSLLSSTQYINIFLYKLYIDYDK